jgi:hypothetical protein
MASTLFPPPVTSLGYFTGNPSIYPPVFLDGVNLSVAAANFGTLTIPAFNTLWIEINVSGFSGSDFLSLRFNGDTGTNYVSRYLTAVAGGVVVVDNPFVSATALRITPISGTLAAHTSMKINNTAAVSKVCQISTILTTGAAGTAPTAVLSGAGEWVNTTAQITSVLGLVGGANNFNAGSSISIWGSN